jgi:hypothetical protein
MLGSCSVATQNSATALPPQLTLPPTTATTTTLVTPGTHQLKVYFLKGGRLFAVQRPYSTDPLVAALTALEGGPTPKEIDDEGITTAFSESPADITSAGTRDGGKIALVEIDVAFITLPGEAFEEASAQIVFTITGLAGGPTSVEFFLNTTRIQALIPPGSLVTRPVTRNDYCLLAPANTACSLS